MKLKLVLNPHGRNHFKYCPYSVIKKGEDEDLSKLEEKKQIELAELIYKRLEREGEIIYEKIKTGSHSIKCVKLEENYYIIVCIRNEFETYNNTIYEYPNRNDAVAISKFIARNIRATMNDYKKQILDAKKMVVKKEENNEGNKISEND